LDPREMLAEMTSRWHPFPNRNAALGSYDYFSQTVNLAAVIPTQPR
jgi:hypothetical protein